MKSRILFVATIVVALVSGASSCEKNNQRCGEKNNSATGSNRSHNVGHNCMNCHQEGGSGEGCFIVAGTTFNSSGSTAYPNATIKLYTQPNGGGTLAATIEGDAKGNFHSTDNLDFGSGLYPVVTNTIGQSVYMSSAITQGACNSCHGVNQDRISTF